MERGASQRATGSTKLNEISSRSHAVFMIIAENSVMDLCNENIENDENTKVFKDIGMFNEKYFLFWEEVDLCRRIRSKNLSIIICHDSQAKHIEGSSSY